jgi:hypothetical protein
MVKFHSNPSYSQQYLELNSDTSGVSGKQHGKCKGKVVLCFFLTEHHAMKAYWGSGGIAPRILDLGTDGGKWSASRPDRFTPRERAPRTH